MIVPASPDATYARILLTPLKECANYRPAFGQNEDAGIDLPQFRQLYGDDPLYHWIGLDSDLMYAAHKAAGGMTSIYRQLGIGCERLLRRVMQDCLGLTDAEAAWSYTYDKGNGQFATHTLDARAEARHVRDPASRARLLDWTKDAAMHLGLPAQRAGELVGAALGLRRAGWTTLACIERDEAAAGTLAAADFPVLRSDVREVDWSAFAGRADLVWASPPCQPGSTAGRRLAARDPRDGWPWTFDALDAARPGKRWAIR